MCLFAEYLGNDRTKNIEDVLGPLPTSKTTFRNKHFLLTCTLPMKLKHHENGHVQVIDFCFICLRFVTKQSYFLFLYLD